MINLFSLVYEALFKSNLWNDPVKDGATTGSIAGKQWLDHSCSCLAKHMAGIAFAIPAYLH
ncbi:MAG: hypothetical protein P1U74_00375 [Legionellaceae bacterium]|nr:hypothetical protein [Legionellaceae bacterium]